MLALLELLLITVVATVLVVTVWAEELQIGELFSELNREALGVRIVGVGVGERVGEGERDEDIRGS